MALANRMSASSSQQAKKRSPIVLGPFHLGLLPTACVSCKDNGSVSKHLVARTCLQLFRQAKVGFIDLKECLNVPLLPIDANNHIVRQVCTRGKQCQPLPRMVPISYEHNLHRTGKLPSYRTFARFDQIMTDCGLWETARQRVISFNLEQGVLEVENTLVADTTYVKAKATYGKQMKTCVAKKTVIAPRYPPMTMLGLSIRAMPCPMWVIKFRCSVGQRDNLH